MKGAVVSEPRSVGNLYLICQRFCLSSYFTIWLLMVAYFLLGVALVAFQLIFLRAVIFITLPLTALFLPILFSTVMLIRVYGIIIDDHNTQKHSWSIATHKFWPLLLGKFLHNACIVCILGIPYGLFSLLDLLFSEPGIFGVIVLGLLQIVSSILAIFIAIKLYFWRIIYITTDSHLLASFAQSYHITIGSWWLVFKVVIIPFLVIIALGMFIGLLKGLAASTLFIVILTVCAVLYAIIVIIPWIYVTQVVLLEELEVRYEIHRTEQLAKKWGKR